MATNICAHIFRGAVNIAAAPLWCHTGCEKKRFRKDVKVFENSCLSIAKTSENELFFKLKRLARARRFSFIKQFVFDRFSYTKRDENSFLNHQNSFPKWQNSFPKGQNSFPQDFTQVPSTRFRTKKPAWLSWLRIGPSLTRDSSAEAAGNYRGTESQSIERAREIWHFSYRLSQ